MRNRRPGTDCEQNSLRYFCAAKGGCHIAGDGGKGGWAACRGCLVGAAPGYEVPDLECSTPCLHQLILQRRLHRTTMVKRKAHNRIADCVPQTSHRPRSLILILPLDSQQGCMCKVILDFQLIVCHCNLEIKKDVEEQRCA